MESIARVFKSKFPVKLQDSIKNALQIPRDFKPILWNESIVLLRRKRHLSQKHLRCLGSRLVVSPRGARAALNGGVRTVWVQGKGRERKGKEGKGRERNGKEGKEREKGKGRERKGKEGKGRERKREKGKDGKRREIKGKKERKGKEGNGRERNGQQGKGKEGKGRERKGRKGKEGKERERKGKKGKGRERKGEVDLEISRRRMTVNLLGYCAPSLIYSFYFVRS